MKTCKSTLILTIFIFTIFTKVFTAPAAKTDNVTVTGGDKTESQKNVSTNVTEVQRSNPKTGETIKRIDNEQTKDKQKTTEIKETIIESKTRKVTSGITLRSETKSVGKSETKGSKMTQLSSTKRPAVAKTKVSLTKQVKPSFSTNLPITDDKTKISVVKQIISPTSTKQPTEDKTKVRVTTRTQQGRISPTSTKQPTEDKTKVRVTTRTQQGRISPTSTKQPTEDKTKVRVTTRTQKRQASNIETRSKILGTKGANIGVTGKSAILPSTSVVDGIKETRKTKTAQTTSIKQSTNINLPSSMKSKETTEMKSNEQTKLTLKGSQNLNSGAKTVTSHSSVTSNKELLTSGNERKSNTVQRNIVTTVTTTEATVTEGYDTVTTWDGLDCNSRFKPHPEDKSKFEAAFSDNVFEKLYQSCPAPLIWRQEQCRCGWADPEIFDAESTCMCCSQGLRAHPSNPAMYQRLVNGQWSDEICSTYDNNQLWNDDNCTCVWDPNKPQSHKAPVFKGAVLPRMMTKCMNLVNMTLDEGLKDANGRDLTPIFGGHRIRVVDETGNIGKSIEIRRAPFKLGIFNGNDLQSTVYFKFNFKVHDSRVRQRKKMVIISNGCRRRWQRKTIQPSLEVSFIPSNETFEVQFSTTGKRIVEYMKGSKDVNGWYQCVLYLQDRVLNFKVNGQKVYSTNGMSGGVKSTDCPLTVAGSPTNAKNHFDGYLDEFHVVKQCKYDQDTI